MSTSHPRRTAMPLTSAPSAPQITSAVELTSRSPHARIVRTIRGLLAGKCCFVRTIRTFGKIEVRKAQDADERVVEVRAARQLDVLDPRGQLEGDLPLPVREERDLGPLACRVAP